MARDLGVPLHEILYKGQRLARYLMSVSATVKVIVRERPRVVFASNPSFVLTAALIMLRPFMRFRLISDAHYGGVVAVTGSRMLQKTLDSINRTTDTTIVTNQGHANMIAALGGRPFVCPDPLPTLPPHKPAPHDPASKKVMVICSFDLDEPFREIIAAATILRRHGFKIYMSGNYRKAGLSPEQAPDVHLLGYVPRDVYWKYLLDATVILDLTTFENCLVCGAYESMAAEKPLVLSDTEALQRYFTHGTVFTKHSADEIAAAVRQAYADRERLVSEIIEWKTENARYMANTIGQLRRLARLDGRDPSGGATRESALAVSEGAGEI